MVVLAAEDGEIVDSVEIAPEILDVESLPVYVGFELIFDAPRQAILANVAGRAMRFGAAP